MTYTILSAPKRDSQPESSTPTIDFSLAQATQKYAAGGMDPEKVEVGRRIRQAREAKDLSQNDLARHLNLTGGAIGQWELGITIPRAQTIIRLTRLLGVSYEWLMAKGSSKTEIGQDGSEKKVLQLFRKLSGVEQEMVIRQLEGLTRSKR